jgi:hypothetical protein
MFLQYQLFQDEDRRIMGGQPRYKLTRPYFKNKLGIVVNACNSSYSGSRSRRIKYKAILGRSSKPYLKKRK